MNLFSSHYGQSEEAARTHDNLTNAKMQCKSRGSYVTKEDFGARKSKMRTLEMGDFEPRIDGTTQISDEKVWARGRAE